MDLSQPLSSLIPTLDAETLTVLARTEQPLTGRRVAELTRRGTHPAIQKVLDRLADHGLVDVQPAGPARLYTLNREHLLAAPVLAAVAVRETLLTRLREGIRTWGVPCIHASLFGSLARGDAGAESDIDILVIRAASTPEDDPTWQRQLATLEHQVSRWTGNPLAWFETTEEALTRTLAHPNHDEEPVVSSWRQDAVGLAGESLHSLLARLDESTSPKVRR